MGSGGFSGPLSAEAQTPSRPSGGAKQQEPAENEGGAGRGVHSLPGHRAEIAARRHCQTLVTVQRSRIKVNSALRRYGPGLLLAEDLGPAQGAVSFLPQGALGFFQRLERIAGDLRVFELESFQRLDDRR